MTPPISSRKESHVGPWTVQVKMKGSSGSPIEVAADMLLGLEDPSLPAAKNPCWMESMRRVFFLSIGGRLVVLVVI